MGGAMASCESGGGGLESEDYYSTMTNRILLGCKVPVVCNAWKRPPASSQAEEQLPRRYVLKPPLPPAIETGDRRVLVIRPTVCARMDTQGCRNLKSEIDQVLCQSGYNAATDEVFLAGDIFLSGSHCVDIVRWAYSTPHIHAVRSESNGAFLAAQREWHRIQKRGDPPLAKYGYVRHFTGDEIEWLASLPSCVELPD